MMSRLFSILGFLLLSLLAAPASAADKDRSVKELAGKLDQWFTVEDAAKIAGKAAGDAKVSYARSEKRPITEVVEYSWKGDRKRMTTGALKLERPVADSLKAGWPRKATLQELRTMRETTEGEEIAGVGEFAFLSKDGQQYIFFKNGVRFSVWVDLSDDPKVNTEHAVVVARLLLEKL